MQYFNEVNNNVSIALNQFIEPLLSNKNYYHKSVINESTEEHALSRVSIETLNEIKNKNIYKDKNDYSFIVIGISNYDDVHSSIKNFLKEYLQTDIKIRLAGKYWYPPNGYLGWHKDTEGIRLYCNYAKESNKSFFRYESNNEIITSWDKEGWNFRLFKTTEESPFWHCVYSQTDRISIGFRLNTSSIGNINAELSA